MGNEILRILGAEDTITDIETFTYDTLYSQLFEAFFPNLNLNQMQPGETAEEMAANIQALIDLLAESILEIDLSFISAQGIVTGDVMHISKFLEVILEVIVHMAQEQGEGEEEEEEGEGQKEVGESPAKSDPLVESDHEEPPKVEGKSAGGKKVTDMPDFYGINQPEMKQVLVDDDLEDDKLFRDEEPKVEDEDPFQGQNDEEMKFEDNEPQLRPDDLADDEPSPSPENLDVMNDPLLPDVGDDSEDSLGGHF